MKKRQLISTILVCIGLAIFLMDLHLDKKSINVERSAHSSTTINSDRRVSSQTNYNINLPLEKFNANFFSVDIPKGWRIVTGGHCGTFAFIAYDPQKPIRRIFFFEGIGPVYMSARQKQIDWQYMMSGGLRIQYYEMPVIQPFTPANFLQNFHLIARTSIARSFMPRIPILDDLKIFSGGTISSPFSAMGGSTGLYRAIFTEDGELGEGLFNVSTMPFMPFMNAPGGGTGYGVMLSGITAPSDQFRFILHSLIQAIGTFKMNNGYIQQCMAESKQSYQAAIQEGQNLSKVADDYNRSWEKNQRTTDIGVEKYCDAILGKERLYNPDTGDVYEFNNGFYDKYKKDPQAYKYKNLRPLTDKDYNLWTMPALNGYREIAR